MGDYYCYTKGVCQNASHDPQSSWYYLSTTWKLCELEYSPNDDDFSDQWYVRSHNVIAAWKEGYRGGRSTVVIVDDGIDYTHPDLAVDRNLSFGWSFDGLRVPTADVSSERNPDGRQPDHGTMCAGVNKAICNNSIDLCGIAHDSTLIGVRLLREFSYSEEDVEEGTTATPVGGPLLPMYDGGAGRLPPLLHPFTSSPDGAFVDPYFNASLHSTNRTHNHSIPTFERALTLIDSATIETLRELSTRECTVISNSWGPRDGQGYIEGPGLRLWYASIDQAFRSIVPTGRNGKGMILVFAAGNGGPSDNVNDDGYASHDNTIAIAAIGSNGRRTIYSEPGTCIDAVAYSSDYAQTFGTSHVISLSGTSVSGQSLFCCTSAAAAIASGIVALVLDARPDLTIRDVRQILQRTAFRTDRNDASWTLNAGGRWYSHWYGFGAIDAHAAVLRALQWPTLDTQEESQSYRWQVPIAIEREWTTLTFEGTPTWLQGVEEVIVWMDIDHPERRDLELRVVSPSGTISQLTWRLTGNPTMRQRSFIPRKFVTFAFMDESSLQLGWKLQMRDLPGGPRGTLKEAYIVVRGVRRNLLLGDNSTFLPPTPRCQKTFSSRWTWSSRETPLRSIKPSSDERWPSSRLSQKAPSNCT